MLLTNTHNNTISVKFIGEKITRTEMTQLYHEIEQLSASHPRINVLMLLGHQQKLNVLSFCESFREAHQLSKFISKVAIISDHHMELGAALTTTFFHWKEKYFNIDHINQAWEWLNNQS
jgi:hypothetical protein